MTIKFTAFLFVGPGRILAIVLFLCMNPASAHAQWMGRQTGCYAPKIEANPNRPTVANPADITQYGVLEVEYGWDHAWLGAGDRLTDLAGLVKFGLLCDVELRWTPPALLHPRNEAGSQTGFGDSWIGAQIRFYRQTAHVPALAVSWAAKVPTASREKGLGSGRFDQVVTFLASKDLYGTHFDFNASYFLIGRPAASGFDRTAQLNLSFSHPLKGHLSFTGELYGTTELNASTPGFVSMLSAVTYTITPRLVIDGGIDVGLTHGAPQKRAFVGVTYAIANIYEALNRRKPKVDKNKNSK